MNTFTGEVKTPGMVAAFLFGVIVALTCIGVASSCSCTIAAKQPVEHQASYDNNIKNSGFLGYTNGFGILTTNALTRYNALITLYGTNIIFVPVLHENFGIVHSNGMILITKDGLVKFGQLTTLHNSK